MASLDVGARICLHRLPRYSGKLLTWTVTVDAREAGRIKSGATLELPVAAGAHRIQLHLPFSVGLARGRSKPFDVTVDAGDVVRLVCMPNALTGRPVIDTDADSAAAVGAPDRSRVGDPTPDRPEAHLGGTDIVEAGRHEVPLGDETRVIDNSRSSSPTVRVMRVTKEWTKSYTLDVERATTIKGSAALTVLAALKAEAERTISRHYSASAEERQSFEEEVTLNIGAGIRSEVLFSWKEIRQSGTVVLDSGGATVQIPFEVVVGLTFDQRQIDVRTDS
jgi:hypothetical protein